MFSDCQAPQNKRCSDRHALSRCNLNLSRHFVVYIGHVKEIEFGFKLRSVRTKPQRINAVDSNWKPLGYRSDWNMAFQLRHDFQNLWVDSPVVQIGNRAKK
jgi:hypothetical protein